jgi:hypothetical protein
MVTSNYSSKVFFLTLLFSFLLFLGAAQKVFSAASHIVISQVQTNGAGVGTTNDEFVELYNPTDSAVNLSDWKLRKKTAAQAGLGTDLASSLSGTIQPHAYFLIAHASYSGVIAEDFTYNAAGIAEDNNTVLLYNNLDDTPVDKVGMGSAGDNEASAAANPAHGGSIQRKLDEVGAHGLDTDNNSSDFELLATSTPRNSAVTVATPTPSPTATATATPTESPTPTPSESPTATPTATPTQSPTPTPTETPTSTPTATPTPTPTPSSTPTPIFSHVIGVFNFPGHRTECRIFYVLVDGGFFKALLPSIVCVRM